MRYILLFMVVLFLNGCVSLTKYKKLKAELSDVRWSEIAKDLNTYYNYQADRKIYVDRAILAEIDLRNCKRGYKDHKIYFMGMMDEWGYRCNGDKWDEKFELRASTTILKSLCEEKLKESTK